MVIQTEHRLRPGEIVRNGLVSNHERNYRPLTFQVLREATRAEFLAYCAAEGIAAVVPANERFYLISPD